MFAEGKAYIEKIYDGYVIRTFESDCPEHFLKWHYDKEDRYLIALNENDWQFQLDNELPRNITNTIFINKGKYHRLIKGTTDLILKIIKNK